MGVVSELPRNLEAWLGQVVRENVRVIMAGALRRELGEGADV